MIYKVETLADFREVIKIVRAKEFQRQFGEGNHVRAVFRGQANSEWPIIPSLVRHGHTLQELMDVEAKIIEEFRNKLKENDLYKYFREGFLPGKYHGEWLFHQQAQHAGLATRFMDWSLKPEVALFFATEKLSDKEGRVSILYGHPLWFASDNNGESYADTKPTTFEKTLLLNPSHMADEEYKNKYLERFKSRQHGTLLMK